MISIIGTVGVPACYGGFETLVENLLDEKEEEQRLTVYCSSHHYPNKQLKYKNADLKYVPLKANGAQSIPYDIYSLLHAVFKEKTKHILLLGVSGAICLPFIRLFSNVNIVTNIDGLEWRRAKWGKLVKAFLKFSEKVAVKYSDVVVADNQAIADYVKSEYSTESEVIAYGGDHAVSGKLDLTNGNYALALCRIEPENNVELILKAFSQTSEHLKFVGNWDNSQFGKEMKRKFGDYQNIELIDPIYDIAILSELRGHCSIYIHGHSAGGTNPSLVEMMHFCKTILAFDCDYNRASTENKADYFYTANELKVSIEDKEYQDNGADMLEIANRRYTWDIVKEQYFSLFNK